MKTFKEYYYEVQSYYKVGEEIKWNMQTVSEYNDISTFGGMDHGKIISVSGNTYTCRLNNGNEVKIKAEDAIAFGSDDVT